MRQRIGILLLWLIALMPFAALVPYTSGFSYLAIYEACERGSGFVVLLLVAFANATLGAMALSGERRVAWIMFWICTLGAWWQGAYFSHVWPFWRERHATMLQSAYVMSATVFLAIPVVVFARRFGVRVEPAIALGLRIVLLCQLLAMAFFAMAFAAFGWRGWERLFSIPSAMFPIIDSMGIRYSIPRLGGIGTSSTTTGAQLVLLWPAVIWNIRLLEEKRGLPLRTVAWVSAAVVGILLTFSRAAYLGLMVQLVILIIYAHRIRPESRPVILKLLGTIVAVVIIAIVATSAIRLRFSALLTPTDASVSNRLYVFGVALRLLGERPLCGWGVGAFNTFYNVFYRLPMVDYPYPDAHSGTLIGLLNLGVIPWVLVIIAVLGMQPWRTLRNFPLWVTLSLVGVCIPWTGDNFGTRYYGVSVPLTMLFGIAALYARRNEGHAFEGRQGGRRWALLLVLMGSWLGNLAVPVRGGGDRIVDEILRAARSARAEVSVAVKNLVTGEMWHLHGQRPYASVLATLGIMGKTLQILDKTTVTIERFRVSPTDAAGQTLSCPAQAWLGMILADPNHVSLPELLTVLDNRKLSSTSEELFQTPLVGGAEARGLICQTCSGSREQRLDAAPVQHSLHEKATSATAMQVLDAYVSLLNAQQGGSVVADALQANRNYAGAARFLPRGPWLFHCGVEEYGGREEVVVYDSGIAQKWALCYVFRPVVFMRTRVDNLANRIAAQIGWRLYTYFEELPPFARDTLPKRTLEPLRSLQDRRLLGEGTGLQF